MRQFALPLFFLIGLPIFPASAFLENKTVAIGKPVQEFELANLEGKPFKSSDAKGKILMLHFWSATCPFVVRYEERLQALTKDYGTQGVVVIGIASNSTENPDQLRKAAMEHGVNYPILIDPDHKIADRFGAVTTPHVYILDKNGNLAYEGSVDDQGWGEANPINKNYARDALDALLKDQPVSTPVTKTFGCSIKR